LAAVAALAPGFRRNDSPARRCCRSVARRRSGGGQIRALGVARRLLHRLAMSAIPSLLRVMTLRDAEAIILEASKVPSLRRRGQIEKLAMPALDAEMLAEFAAPLLAGRSLEDSAISLAFQHPDGPHYQVTIEKVAAGLRIIVRPGKPPSGPAAPHGATPAAHGATPAAHGAVATAASPADTPARTSVAARPASTKPRPPAARRVYWNQLASVKNLKSPTLPCAPASLRSSKPSATRRNPNPPSQFVSLGGDSNGKCQTEKFANLARGAGRVISGSF
jgi:hypothetical protein